jgi:hypothetical protein
MADPLWLADVLREEGLNVIEHDGWRDRGHDDFLDIRGVIGHHTAGGGTSDWIIVQNGRSDLPGPLAQLVLERDGTFRVIAAGVCWHAGHGSWPGWPTDNANYHTIGIEAVNNGVGQEWPAVQLDAYKRGSAAILRKIGRDANDFAGHKEYSSEGKIDPAGIDLDGFRRDIQQIIDAGPGEGDEFMGVSFKNDNGDTIDAATALYFLDKHVGLILDQLGGPDTRKGADFPGWAILGGDTVVEAIAKIRADVEALKAAK